MERWDEVSLRVLQFLKAPLVAIGGYKMTFPPHWFCFFLDGILLRWLWSMRSISIVTYLGSPVATLNIRSDPNWYLDRVKLDLSDADTKRIRMFRQWYNRF